MPPKVIQIPDWLRPENRSVFDSIPVQALQKVSDFFGLADPSQVMQVATGVAVPGGDLGGIAGAVAKKFPRFAQAIKAYHGSPHDFEQFDSSKIGTGEGAQAYGHGLYFAENQSVAASYKKAGVLDPRDAMSAIIDSAKTYNGDDMQLRNVIKSGLYQHPALSNFGDSDSVVDDLVRVVRGQEPGGTVSNDAIQSYRRIDRLLGELPKGRMYEVNIKAGPHEFLDWDKPLSQQPQISEKITPESLGLTFKRLDNGYMAFVNEQNRPVGNFQSGGTPESFRKNWTESLLREDLTGRDLYQRIGTPAEASAALKRAGIPGVKYLDAGSRAAGEGSRNYVVFNEKTVELLRKYGLLLPVAGASIPAIQKPGE